MNEKRILTGKEIEDYFNQPPSDQELVNDAMECADMEIQAANKAVTIIALRAMECALSVGEIHFASSVLAAQVKRQLQHAIKLIKQE